MSIMSRRSLLKSGTSVAAFSAFPALAHPAASTAARAFVEPAKSQPPAISHRTETLLDRNWRFFLGHADDPAKDLGFGRTAREAQYAKNGRLLPAAMPNYDDSAWRAIDLPHDWAIELPFEQAAYLPEHGGQPLGRDFPATSIGWYRHSFTLSPSDAGQRISLRLDGLFRSGLLFLNGMYLGETWSGYAPYTFDLTDMLHPTGPNILLIRVDATFGEGWFYEGAGIYRHTWLIKTPPLYLAEDSATIRTELHGKDASLSFSCEVTNESDATTATNVHISVADSANHQLLEVTTARMTIPTGETRSITATALLREAKLWSPDTPNLYRATFRIESGDTHTATFGVRTLEFDPDRGFLLNGVVTKIKGTCNHHDFAGVGVALPDRIHGYRVERLKDMGSNAMRTSHNPPSEPMLEACDRLGMMVMAETRMMSSSQQGLDQLTRMVKRFRNHPAIVIWSLGNEEREQGSLQGQQMVATMRRLTRTLDPTRLTTLAMNGEWGQGASNSVDVQGCNYNTDKSQIDDFHKAHPHQPMIGSETASTLATRGEYANDPIRGYMSAYDLNKPDWGQTAEAWWKLYDARPFLAGGFAWTGFDYRGEPTPYSWPCISSHFGIMDTCGFPKDDFFYYKAWWGNDPVLHLYPHWNWPGRNGQPIDVWVQSNLDEVELLLNGVSLGSKQVERLTHLQWSVPYAPGTLEAVGRKNGVVLLRDRRETTGPSKSIHLTPDRAALTADGSDVSLITVDILDSKDRTNPLASEFIQFSLTGPGRILGVGNGDPSCHESDVLPQRSAFNGKCMILVQSQQQAGTITLTAKSSGLIDASITIKTNLM